MQKISYVIPCYRSQHTVGAVAVGKDPAGGDHRHHEDDAAV